MKRTGRNVPASVHARLLSRSRQRQEDFNLSLQRYAAERFLYRLGASSHREQFVLKGAMLLPLWGGDLYRATRDLDLSGYIKNDADEVTEAVRDICAVPCPEDGLEFAPESIRVEAIRDSSEYRGFRVKLEVRLGNARLALQVDVGFGDAVEPPPKDEDYPTLLDGPPPRVRAYPREATIAEKLHAMVVLGGANTRYKDFYDLFGQAQQSQFSGQVLARSISATFAGRKTLLPEAVPVALTPGFYSDQTRQAAWSRYLSRGAMTGAPADFATVGSSLTSFLGPVWESVKASRTLAASWPPGGPWQMMT